MHSISTRAPRGPTEGLQWDGTKRCGQLGIISADFAETRTGTGGGYSYIGIQGWANEPLVNFFIIGASLAGAMPGGPVGAQFKGTYVIDGGTYNLCLAAGGEVMFLGMGNMRFITASGRLLANAGIFPLPTTLITGSVKA